jgi:hypothetical protein
LVALARAQRRALKAAHTELEADPLLAHLLKSRISYRHVNERSGKSCKPVEKMVRSSFFVAQSREFRGGIKDWRNLLAIFPRLPLAMTS